MQPLPVPTSAALMGVPASRAIATARCTRTSVSGLGTSTSRLTSKSRAMNSLWPTRYATGSRRARRASRSRSRARLRAGRGLLSSELQVVEPRTPNAQRFFTVPKLRLLVLHAHDQAGRLVCHADGGVGRVDALTSWAGGGRGFDLEILRLDLDL